MSPGTIQHTVLCFVQDNPVSTPDGVARGVGLSQPQSSNALRTLWKRGHLTRRFNEHRQFEYTALTCADRFVAERYGYGHTI